MLGAAQVGAQSMIGRWYLVGAAQCMLGRHHSLSATQQAAKLVPTGSLTCRHNDAHRDSGGLRSGDNPILGHFG